MSGFSLLPVDGGDPIQLQPGETVLGRGPLLRVVDKRVSRYHGLLENLNGQLRLKPTHLNPCFVQSSLTDDPRPLQKDTWHHLHHGDFFSLLPGQFVYKVVAEGGEDSTPRNSQLFEEEDDLPEPDVEQTPPHEETTLAALSNEEEEEGEEDNSPSRSLNKGDAALPKNMENEQRHVTPPAAKRRVLPAWMMAAVSASHTSSSSSPKAVKRSKGPAAASTSKKRAAANQDTPISPEGAGLGEEEEEEMPQKKRRRKMSDEEAQSKTESTFRLQSESNKVPESDESDNFTMEVEEEGQGGETSTADQSSTTRMSDASESENKKIKNGQKTTKKAESGSSNGGSASKPRVRSPCPYGKDCYRKNPLHFQECSHPGDTDYDEEEEEEEEADRPECPYGTDCYRKNPLHRKEYKHTKRPARTTRTVPQKSLADDEDDDFGEDDSFINDDSEDVDDDSDYTPPDSDDSGKEDIKQLQREAKALLKRRK